MKFQDQYLTVSPTLLPKQYVFILAKDWRQAESWAFENRLKRGRFSHPERGWLIIQYLDHPERACGLRGVGYFVEFGTYFEHRDYDRLRGLLRALDFQELPPEKIKEFQDYLADPDTVMVSR